MGFRTKKTEEEKSAEWRAKADARVAEAKAADEARAGQKALAAANAEMLEAHIASSPKWEYQVKRVGEDKQKGLLGSQRMESIFNEEGAKGWELVAVSQERATFKRRLPK